MIPSFAVKIIACKCWGIYDIIQEIETEHNQVNDSSD